MKPFGQKSSNKYEVIYSNLVYKDLAKIDSYFFNIIKDNIENKLVLDPFIYGERLKGSAKEYFKFRISNYRIIYKIENNIIIIIILIAHRKDVYQKLLRRI